MNIIINFEKKNINFQLYLRPVNTQVKYRKGT